MRPHVASGGVPSEWPAGHLILRHDEQWSLSLVFRRRILSSGAFPVGVAAAWARHGDVIVIADPEQALHVVQPLGTASRDASGESRAAR